MSIHAENPLWPSVTYLTETASEKLGIRPSSGETEKHLRAVDVLARRASVEEVTGGLLERVAHDPDQLEAVQAEVSA